MKTQPENVIARAEKILEESSEKDKIIEKMKSSELSNKINSVVDEFLKINETKIFINAFRDIGPDSLREMADKIKDKNNDVIVLLFSENKGKVNIVCLVSDNNIKKGLNAGSLIKTAAGITGGGGGGRPDFAQAGGKNPEKIDDENNK